MLLFFCATLFLCCNVNKNIHGEYYLSRYGYSYDIIFHRDSTFVLNHKTIETDAICKGRYYNNSYGMLLMHCDNTDSSMQTFYPQSMSDLRTKVSIISKRKIIYDDQILKRVPKRKKSKIDDSGMR